MNESTQRWVTRLVGLGVVGLVGYLTLEATPTPAAKTDGPAQPVAVVPASSEDASTAQGAVDAGPPELDLPLAFANLGDADGGALSASAPRTVRIGVVLVAWAGAEGAKPSAPPKPEALTKAQRLAQQARTDFSGAVKEGDPESMLDVGRIPRRVLDPRTEVAVFNLTAGEVSEPLETPRGYWIVKRIE